MRRGICVAALLLAPVAGVAQPADAVKRFAPGRAFPAITGSGLPVVALNPDTGKMQWYFQSSPHDTHDWDATQTPALFDGEINGQKRELVAQASRNGYFFVLDRTN